jgi:hypothetical protein
MFDEANVAYCFSFPTFLPKLPWVLPYNHHWPWHAAAAAKPTAADAQSEKASMKITFLTPFLHCFRASSRRTPPNPNWFSCGGHQPTFQLLNPFPQTANFSDGLQTLSLR